MSGSFLHISGSIRMFLCSRFIRLAPYHYVVPTITKMNNLSLSTGTFPMQFKDSVVRPLLKKTIPRARQGTPLKLPSNLKSLFPIEDDSKIADRRNKSSVGLTTIVHSKLHYCNSLFCSNETPETIQNALAKAIAKTPHDHHMAPVTT